MAVLCSWYGELSEYGELKPDFNVPDILKEGHEVAGKLISMNDGGRYSFNKLADWIDKNL